MEDLRFPVGRFQPSKAITPELKKVWIQEISEAPREMRRATTGLSDTQLDTPYRPEGWTVRQVVHHVPDSHMNSFIRFKLALTEENPVIKPYDEASWAKLSDAAALIEPSLVLLEALHFRWTTLLTGITEDQWKRTFRHPEMGERTLEQTLAIYAWHGRHHVAHVTRLRDRMGW